MTPAQRARLSELQDIDADGFLDADTAAELRELLNVENAAWAAEHYAEIMGNQPECAQ